MKIRPPLFLGILIISGLACSGGGGGSSAPATPTPVSSAAASSGAGASAASTPSSSSSTAAPAPKTLPAGSWLSGDLHSHSAPHSDDARRQLGDRVGVCIGLAEFQRLDFWALTDHNTVAGLSEQDFQSNQLTLLGGEEWGSGAHAGIIGITQAVPEIDTSLDPATWNDQAQAAIDEAHRQGGIFIINHPTRKSPWIYDVQGFDAIEVWNTFWAFRQNESLSPQRVQDQSQRLADAGAPVNPAIIEAASFPLPKREQAIKFWEHYLNKGVRVPATGGGDRHMLMPPGYPSTFVFAADDSPAAILEGIKRGRVFIANHPDGPRLSFTADADGDGQDECMIGDEVPAGAPVRFTIKVSDGAPGDLVLIKNGQVLQQESFAAMPAELVVTDTPQPGDWYRVDVYENLDLNAPGNGDLLGVSTSASALDPDFGDPFFYLFLYNLVRAIPEIRSDFSLGTLLPTLTWSREQIRVLNADLAQRSRCRAIISSPIYAGN